MLDFTQIQAVFPIDGPKPYDQKGVKEIETFRKSFDGILFVDRVLRALGITEGKHTIHAAHSQFLLTRPDHS